MELLPLWIYHKIDPKKIYCPAQSSGCPQFFKKNKNDGVIPHSAVGPAHNAGPFSFPGEISPKKREFKKKKS
jgi:hypothetical protein